jgi:hypothetical protein
MAFINNKKYLEISQAAKSGNEKAKMILQAMLKGNSQDELDGLVNDYYNVVNDVPPIEEINSYQEEQPAVEEEVVEAYDTTQEVQPEAVDLTSLLDGEMDGLLDENILDELSFSDYLSNKKKDAIRSKKNNDYFKAFDLDGRTKYVENKKNAYNNKFDASRRDIERHHNDLETSINSYSDKVNLMLDDDYDLNMDTANQAYEELTGNENAMKSFGRHWDQMDNDNMESVLRELVVKYGKKNVMAVLNTLKGDNDNYSNFKTNQIDTEISRYSKNLENLLK